MGEEPMSVTLVIGDVHGQVEKLLALLRGADLIDREENWSGADSALWFMGDLVDHGPHGIAAIALVMRLQEEASRTGGHVGVLLGNHDVLLLAAARFGMQPLPGSDKTFRQTWEESGGVADDLARLTPDHIAWLSSRPAMARAGNHLLIHADALLYTRFGSTINETNGAIATLLRSNDAARWARLLDEFGEHGAFVNAASGTVEAEAFLLCYGGEQIVHGHTPISKMTGQPAEAVREPLLYAGNRCLDIDAGLYLGGPGFVYRLTG